MLLKIILDFVNAVCYTEKENVGNVFENSNLEEGANYPKISDSSI
jgi:hypothetical protein